MLLIFLPRVVSVVVMHTRPIGSGQEIRRPNPSDLQRVPRNDTWPRFFSRPINMLFSAKFVLFTLLGQGVSWVGQNRRADADGIDWREAILTHSGQTAIAIVWAVSSWILVPPYFWWLSPVLAGLIFSIPISIVFSKTSLGKTARQHGFFLTPEETAPPPELRQLLENLLACYRRFPPFEPLRPDYGMMQAVLDPYINAMHVSLLRQRRPSEEARERFGQIRQRVLRDGPAGITSKEKMALLLDSESMIWLHRELWSCPVGTLADWWRLAMRQYNVLTAGPATPLYR